MSEDLLLPDENNIGLMLREYNLIAARNKMLEGNCFVNNDCLGAQTVSTAEQSRFLSAEYAALYCMEEDICTSMYRLHSLANARNREEIGAIIKEIKRNAKRLLECHAESCDDKLNYAPKIELSMNYRALLKEVAEAERLILFRLTAIESPCERLHAAAHTQLAINGALNGLIAAYKL